MTGVAAGDEIERFFSNVYGQSLSTAPDIFAVGWFRLEPGIEVFLLRTPSQYDVSALTLWVIDTLAPDWSHPIEAADSFGDAGWSFQKQGWLIVSDPGRDRELVVRRVDRDIDLESDDEEVRIGPDSLYSVSLRRFVRGDREVRPLADTLRHRFPLPGYP